MDRSTAERRVEQLRADLERAKQQVYLLDGALQDAEWFVDGWDTDTPTNHIPSDDERTLTALKEAGGRKRGMAKVPTKEE